MAEDILSSEQQLLNVEQQPQEAVNETESDGIPPVINVDTNQFPQKVKTYEVKGKVATVKPQAVEEFMATYPDAVEVLRFEVDGKKATVKPESAYEFVKKYPNAISLNYDVSTPKKPQAPQQPISIFQDNKQTVVPEQPQTEIKEPRKRTKSEIKNSFNLPEDGSLFTKPDSIYENINTTFQTPDGRMVNLWDDKFGVSITTADGITRPFNINEDMQSVPADQKGNLMRFIGIQQNVVKQNNERAKVYYQKLANEGNMTDDEKMQYANIFGSQYLNNIQGDAYNNLQQSYSDLEKSSSYYKDKGLDTKWDKQKQRQFIQQIQEQDAQRGRTVYANPFDVKTTYETSRGRIRNSVEEYKKLHENLKTKKTEVEQEIQTLKAELRKWGNMPFETKGRDAKMTEITNKLNNAYSLVESITYTRGSVAKSIMDIENYINKPTKEGANAVWYELKNMDLSNMLLIGFATPLRDIPTLQIAKKKASGVPLTDDEEFALNLYQLNEMVKSSIPSTSSGNVIYALSEAIPYMASLALTGGTGTALKIGTETLLKKMLPKFAMSNSINRAIGATVMATFQGAMLGSTVESAVNATIANPETNLWYNLLKEVPSAALSSMIETRLVPLVSNLSKMTTKEIGSIYAQSLRKSVTGKIDDVVSSTLGSTKELVILNEFVGEFGEEKADQFKSILLGEDSWRNFLSLRSNLETFTVVALMQGGGKILKKGIQGVDVLDSRKEYLKSMSQLPEQFKVDLITALNQPTPQQQQEAFSKIPLEQVTNIEDRRKIVDFLNAKASYDFTKGALMGKQQLDVAEGTVQQAMDYAQGIENADGNIVLITDKETGKKYISKAFNPETGMHIAIPYDGSEIVALSETTVDIAETIPTIEFAQGIVQNKLEELKLAQQQQEAVQDMEDVQMASDVMQQQGGSYDVGDQVTINGKQATITGSNDGRGNFMVTIETPDGIGESVIANQSMFDSEVSEQPLSETEITAENQTTDNQEVSQEVAPSGDNANVQADIEAKKADIERRRQEELSKSAENKFTESVFKTKVYHASKFKDNIIENGYDFSKIGSTTDLGAFGSGMYFYTDKKTAIDSQYNNFGYNEDFTEYTGSDKNVIENYIDVKNPYNWNDNPLKITPEQRDANPRAVTDMLLENGYDGAMFTYDGGGQTEVVVFNPSQIKITNSEKEINAKYDAELQALESTQPTDVSTQPQTINTEATDVSTQPTPEIPRLKDGSPDFDNMQPEMLGVELEKQFGNDRAKSILLNQIKNQREALKRLDKKKAKTINEEAKNDTEKNKVKDNIKRLETSLMGITESTAPTMKKREQPKQKVVSNDIQQISEVYQSSPKVYGRSKQMTLPNGEKVKGRFVLIEAGSAVPSHDPFTFEKTKGFPTTETGTTVNDRDYEKDEKAQGEVILQSQKLDDRAYSNPVMITSDGIVVSGNQRTMTRIRAVQQGTDTDYTTPLREDIDMYGISQEQFDNLNNPQLVFELDETPDYTTNTFAKFNTEDKKSQSTTESAVKVSKTIKPDTISKIGDILDKYETLGEFYSDNQAIAEALTILQTDGVIRGNDVARLVKSDGVGLSDSGKEFFETLLIGSVLNESAIRQIDVEGMRNVKQKIAKAIVPIVNNAKLKEYNLVAEISEAVNIVERARKNKLSVSNYISNGNIFDKNEYSDAGVFFAVLLDNSKESQFRNAIINYNTNAILAESGQMDIFSGEVTTKEQIVETLIQNADAETKQIQQKAWDAVKQNRDANAFFATGTTPTGSTDVTDVAETPTSTEATSEVKESISPTPETPTETKQRQKEVVADALGIESQRITEVETMLNELSDKTKKQAKTTVVRSNADAIVQMKKDKVDTALIEAFQDVVAKGHKPEAIMTNNGLYIVSSNIKDTQRAVEVWMHEQAGHYGIRLIMPDATQRKAFFTDVYNSVGEANIRKELEEGYDKVTDKAKLGEEYFGRVCEKVVKQTSLNELEQGVWENFLNKLREFISNLLPSAKLSQGQIESIAKASIQNIIEVRQKTDIQARQKMADIEVKADSTNTNPTEAQKEAGNYPKAKVSIQGLKITIENPKGSVRSGTDKEGNEWFVEMNNHYGYFNGTKAKDWDKKLGKPDKIDVFIGDNPTSKKVFVVDQVDTETREFDESKVMLGFDTIEDAELNYLLNYEAGWQGLGKITEVDMDTFKTWLNDGKRQLKPFGEYKEFKKETPMFSIAPESIEDKLSRLTPLQRKQAEQSISGINKQIDENQTAINNLQKEIDKKRKSIDSRISQATQTSMFDEPTKDDYITTIADVFAPDLSQQRRAEVLKPMQKQLQALQTQYNDLVKQRRDKVNQAITQAKSQLEMDFDAMFSISPTKEYKPIPKQYYDKLLTRLNKAFPNVSISTDTAEMERVLNAVEGGKQMLSVWHGSPHSFDEFTTEKIGTGEGAQAYGWGLYFTDKKSIAEDYANKLRNNDEITDDAIDYLTEKMIDYPEYETLNEYDGLNVYISKDSNSFWVEVDGENKYDDDDYDEIQELKEDIDKKIHKENFPTNLYEVELHQGKEPGEYDYLRWDKPLKDHQIDKIVAQAKKEGFELDVDLIKKNKPNGNDIYREIGALLAQNKGIEFERTREFKSKADKEASLFLLRAGIDGIKYPTEYLSKGQHEETFNYVVFDENAITIENKIQFLTTPTGELYGMTHMGKVYLDGNKMNANAPIHEYGHIWADIAQKQYPEVYNHGLELIKGTEYETTVRESGSYKGLSDEQIWNEALITAIGDRGERIVDKAIRNKFVSWLKDLFNNIRMRLGINRVADLSKFDLSKMDLSEFVKRVNLDLLGGVPISHMSSSDIAKRDADKLIIGIKGATRLDEINEATIRVDNLKVAEEMEATKTPAEIRLATGWERGADNKWRYEVEDIGIKEDALKELQSNQFLSNKDVVIGLVTYRKNDNGTYDLKMMEKGATNTNQHVNYKNISESELINIIDNKKVSDKVINGEGNESFMGANLDEAKEIKTNFTTFITAGSPLNEVIDNKELFSAYPELKDVVVVVDKSNGRNASYYISDGQKIISIGNITNNTKSILTHEIQHAIQSLENFAKGGSVDRFKQVRELNNDLLKEINKIDKALGFDDWFKENVGLIKNIPVSSPTLIQDMKVYYAENILDKKDKKMAQMYKDKMVKAYEIYDLNFKNIYGDKKPTFDDYKDYQRLAGEVEARNAQARMNFTPEQRILQTLASTEDISRADQIIIHDTVSDTPMFSISNEPPLLAPNGKPSNLNKKQYEQVRTKEFKAWFGDWENDPENASKVVDENGEPRPMFHGSKNQFDEFDKKTIKYVGNNGDGFYFTPDIDQAMKYGDNIREFYLNIRNPLKTESKRLTENDYKKLLDNIWKDEEYGQDLKNYGYFDDKNFIQFRNEKAKEFAGYNDYRAIFDLTNTSTGSVQYITDLFNKLNIKSFDGVISESFREWVAFSPTQIKSATANTGTFDPNNPDIRFSIAPKDLEADTKMVTRIKDKVRDVMQDRLLSVKMLQDYVVSKGGTLINATDTKSAVERYSSKVNGRFRIFEMQVLRPLTKFIANIEKTYNLDSYTTRDYLLAKASLARHNAGTSALSEDVNDTWNIEAVKKIITDYEIKVDASDIAELWDKTNAVNDFSMKALKDAGILTKEQYDNIKAKWDFYVPLRGWDLPDEVNKQIELYTEMDKQGIARPGDTTYSEALKKAKGRKSKAYDPISTMSNIAYSSLITAEKNIAEQSMLNFIRQNKDFIEDVAFVKRTWIVKSEDGTKETEVIERPDQSLFDAGRVKNKRNKDTREFSKYVTPQSQQAKQIEVYENGIKYVIEFKQSGVAEAIRGTNMYKMPKVFDVTLGEATRFLSKNLTGLNPDFIPVNFIRDFGYAMLTNYVNANSKISNKSIINEMGQASKAIKAFSWTDNFDETNPLHKDFMNFINNGGATGYVNMQKLEKVKKQIDRDLKVLAGSENKFEKSTRYVKAPFAQATRAIGFLGDMSELIMRYSVYRAGIKAGVSVNESVDMAKNITVNFNRKGRISGVLGGLYAFYNASIQGGNNFATLAYQNKGKMAKVAGMFMAMGALWNIAMTMLMGGNPDDDESYYNVNEFSRYNNLIIPTGGKNYIKIPLPHVFRSFFAMGQIGVEMMTGQKSFTQGILGSMDAMLDGLSPVNLDLMALEGDYAGSTFIRTLLPTTIQPMWDLRFNRNFFGQTITRETFDKSTPKSQLGKANVSPVVRTMAETFNAWSGGDKFKSGVVDINPSAIEYLFESYTGGRGRFYLNLVKIGQSVFDKDIVLETKNIPIGNRFIGENRGKNWGAELKEMQSAIREDNDLMRKYYKNMDESKDFKQKYEAIVEKYDNDIVWTRGTSRNRPTPNLQAVKILDDHNKQSKLIYEDINSAESQVEKDRLYKVVSEMSKETVKKLRVYKIK